MKFWVIVSVLILCNPHCYLPSADQKYPAWPFCVKFGILTVNVVFVEVLYAMIEEYELSGAIAMVASE